MFKLNCLSITESNKTKMYTVHKKIYKRTNSEVAHNCCMGLKSQIKYSFKPSHYNIYISKYSTFQKSYDDQLRRSRCRFSPYTGLLNTF